MNKKSILSQFDIVDKSLKRAKMLIETDLAINSGKEVVLYELIKSYKQIDNIIREFDPDRFGIKLVNVSHTPSLEESRLYLCQICGDPDCQSDHK